MPIMTRDFCSPTTSVRAISNFYMEKSSSSPITQQSDNSWLHLRSFSCQMNYCFQYLQEIAFLDNLFHSIQSRQLKCQQCLKSLQVPMEGIPFHRNLNLIRSNCMGGLMNPSKDVINIYLSAEQHYQVFPESCNVNIWKIVTQVSFSFVVIFFLNFHALETDPLNNHVCKIFRVDQCQIN